MVCFPLVHSGRHNTYQEVVLRGVSDCRIRSAYTVRARRSPLKECHLSHFGHAKSNVLYAVKLSGHADDTKYIASHANLVCTWLCATSSVFVCVGWGIR